MKYHLFAHNAKNFVKVGDKVNKYKTKIGSIGTANGQYWAHLHHSISEGLSVNQLRSYINGWSKSKVKKYYKDPSKTDYEKMFGRKMDVGNRGYGWMDNITNGSPHPGVDVNGLGGGNTDVGYEYTSDCDGTVIYTSETTKQDGWGKMVILEEDQNSPEIVKEPEKASDTTIEPKTQQNSIPNVSAPSNVSVTTPQPINSVDGDKVCYDDIERPYNLIESTWQKNLKEFLEKVVEFINKFKK